MKAILMFKNLTVAALGMIVLTAAGFAQSVDPGKKDVKKDGKQPVAVAPIPAPTVTDGTATDDQKTPEAEAILPYYDNYLREYRLGPSDQISVEVFGQCPDYCKTGITIPPNARISYPLVREGILVAGKTVEQIAAEITKKLDEFIIDPKVTVTLDKANATRYSVMGNVATPGVRVMDRKVSVYEAVLEAGGVTKNGDSKKIALVSYGKDGRLARRIINLAEIEAGKADMVYLSPGDQVFVAGKGFSIAKAFDIMLKVSSLRYMVGTPF
ncbi:MAG: polysaccharide biosynthesis/export family protein [Pyrinomonadaceae bacterium]